MIELLKFSHDCNVPFKQSCDSLMHIIDDFAEQRELDEWYSYFENNYGLPKDVVKQQMKKYLEGRYNYKKAAFLRKSGILGKSTELSLKENLQAVLRHIGFLLYALFASKKYAGAVNTYELIIDWVASRMELLKFSNLIDLFGKKNVLVIAITPLNEPGYKILYHRLPILDKCLYNKPHKVVRMLLCKFYDRKEVIRTLYREIRCGLKLYWKLSFKLKINIISIASHMLYRYLYYSSIFKYNRPKYCIQERHTNTSSIKNFLFHKYGGRCSATIQKSILHRGIHGFYYDIDTLFAPGTKTTERAFEYGARINQVVPVGSMFMEYGWFSNKKSTEPLNKIYDIVYLGVNASKAHQLLYAYAPTSKDYYDTFRWLVTFSKRNPHLRIGIKHHSSNMMDKKEMGIIKNSPVETIDQKLNSYKIAFQSKCALTFCSMMGYELLGHQDYGFPPILFLDPGRRNSVFLPDDDMLDDWRVTNYEDFSKKLKDVLAGKSLAYTRAKPEDFCLNSKNVSERIYSCLTGKETKEKWLAKSVVHSQ